MKKKSLLVIIALFSILHISCEYKDYGLDELFYRKDPTQERAKYLDLSEEKEVKDLVATLPSSYSFLLISDVHFGGEGIKHNGARHEDAFFNLIEEEKDKIKFCIVLGDVAEHGFEEEYKSYKNEMIDTLYSKYNLITFTCIGNHDLYNSGYSNFKTLIYPHTTFYHFSTNKLSYYFLDSASCRLGDRQLGKLRKEFMTDNKRKLAFMHIPLYAEGQFYYALQTTTERDTLISLLNKNQCIGLFCGHDHEEFTSDLGHFNEEVIAGYLERRCYYIVEVDEERGRVRLKRLKYW